MDTKTGLMTVVTLNDEAETPRLEMTCTMTRPTTSSIMAALVRTTPKRDLVSPLVVSTVKVVPKLVEQSAAPAANACNGVAPKRPWRTKESPIGALMPVIATPIDNRRLAFREEKEVARPPKRCWRRENKNHGKPFHTFIHKQDQTKVPKLHDSGLCVVSKPFCSGSAPGDADEDLAKKAAIYGAIQDAIEHVE